MNIVGAFVLLEAALAGFALLNAVFWRDLRLEASTSKRRISLLIPARNEAENLERLLPSLLLCPEKQLEIIVLNDRSEDATAAVVQRYAAQDARLRSLEGQELPKGWLGKNWACHQLAMAASGELLIFTDADTQWQPRAPHAIAAELERCDALCAWPAQVVNDPISRLLQPLQQWSLLAFLPLALVPWRAFPIAVAANGQCLAFTRSCYEGIGGHASVRDQVLEDMALARAVKRHGAQFGLRNGAQAIRTHMYSSAREAIQGYTKNVYPAFGGTPLAFLAVALWNLALYVLPWLWWVLTWRPEALLCVLFGLVARALSDARAGYDLRFTPLHPVSVLVWAYIGVVSMRRFRAGAVSWKGRSYDLRDKTRDDKA